jgi:hypothetical protein
MQGVVLGVVSIVVCLCFDVDGTCKNLTMQGQDQLLRWLKFTLL